MTFQYINFYGKLPDKLQDQYFDLSDIDETHLHTARLFYSTVVNMNEENFATDNEGGDAQAIKEAAVYFNNLFKDMIIEKELFEKYPEYRI